MSPKSAAVDTDDLSRDLEEIQEDLTVIDSIVDLLLGVLYTIATYVAKIIDLF